MNWIKLNKVADIDFNKPLIVLYSYYQPELTDYYFSVLSSAEQARYKTIRNKTELHCRAVLRLILSGFLKIPLHEIRILNTAKGKPYCMNKNVFFNVSHTNKAFIIALSNTGRVGVDMEQLTGNEDIEALADYAFTTEEIQLLAQSQNNPHIFSKIWTHKEAFLKALGVGLTLKLTDINVAVKTQQFGMATHSFCCPNGESATIVCNQIDSLETVFEL
jgi:phosphopantetheinyl transferase